ncbi:MAG: stage II sporulation protein D [Peptococcaceae bacterium]|nr:stage II sporulation protein D [Peptococcaceae bacterium]
MVARVKLPKKQRRRKTIKLYLRVLMFSFVFLGSGIWLYEESGKLLEYTKPVNTTTIQVYDMERNILMSMDLEEYLVGVLAAEMPASFHLSALQAQAVAARTFAMSRIKNPSMKVQTFHPEAQITTSPEICQAWISEEEQRRRWGNSYEIYRQKVAEAVQTTCGQVLTWQGELAEALYHASCGGGNTEAAANVWGNHVPYLVSVACNHPQDKHSQEETVFTWQEFGQKLQLENEVSVGNFGDFISVLSRTAAKHVEKIRVGNRIMTGGQLRSLLGLKSSQFTYQIKEDSIIFKTEGYGHGVGMCQHGADHYAKQGYDYQQILAYYYPGTVVEKW